MENKINKAVLINEITKKLVDVFYATSIIGEASGFDNIFNDLKKKLSDISMLLTICTLYNSYQFSTVSN